MMRSLIRRLVVVTLSVVAVLALVMPAAAHADTFGGFGNRRFIADDCGFFAPVFVIPTSRGNIVVWQDDCGFRRRSFEPFRRFNNFDDDFDGFGGGPRFTVTFNNF
jgi:hypothetical protein